MNLFKGVRPNPYPQKNRRGLGYGCFTKRYRRTVGRYYRHYGFDISEAWNLDITIMDWLSDNVGGFFRQCGEKWEWDEYDLDGNPENDFKRCSEACNQRCDEYCKQLDHWLRTTDEISKDRFIKFVLPRLEYLHKYTIGYPPEFKELSEWVEVLNGMIISFKNNTYSSLFTKHFFELWW